MKEINDMEVDLDDPPTEYPDIDKFKLDVKPFEELWRMVKDQEAKKQIWTEGPLLQLDPEEVDQLREQLARAEADSRALVDERDTLRARLDAHMRLS